MDKKLTLGRKLHRFWVFSRIDSKKKRRRITLSFLALIALAVIIWPLLRGVFEKKETVVISYISYSKFMENLESGKIKKLWRQGEIFEWTSADGKLCRTTIQDANLEFIEKLRKQYHVDVDSSPAPTESFPWTRSLLFVAVLGAWNFFFWKGIDEDGKISVRFWKKPPDKAETRKKVTFNDVGGIREAIEEVMDIIDFFKNPEKFKALGARIPKGVLLIGDTGAGKTHLVRAVANEAGVPFIHRDGSDFIEEFVGVGSKRVRELYEEAERKKPCIIFIDEIDGVGGKRQNGAASSGDKEHHQTLNALLVKMDGFDDNSGIVMFAATNRPDTLDRALTRPGRFDRKVIVPFPNLRGREEILEIHTRGIPLAEDVNLRVMARGTTGFSGADLSLMANEAALFAVKYNRKKVMNADFEEARDKVMMGSEHRSCVLSDEEKNVLAHHEAGHTILLLKTPFADPLHKVTIISRGLAFGITYHMPEIDWQIISRERLTARLIVSMGGRAAEEIFFGTKFNSVGGDFDSVTKTIEEMVCQWGLSDSKELGHLRYERNSFGNFSYSEDTNRAIDLAIKKISDDCYARAKEAMLLYKEETELIAQALLVHETLDAEQVQRIIRGEKLTA